jgi:hypothetical protein
VIARLVEAVPSLPQRVVLLPLLLDDALHLPLGEAHADVPGVAAVLPPALGGQALRGFLGLVKLGEPPEVALGDVQVKEPLVRPAEGLNMQAELIAREVAGLGGELVAELGPGHRRITLP